jgi:hypothetical protein
MFNNIWIIFLIFALLAALLSPTPIESFRDNNLPQYFQSNARLDRSLADIEGPRSPGESRVFSRVPFFNSESDAPVEPHLYFAVAQNHPCRSLGSVPNPLFQESPKTISYLMELRPQRPLGQGWHKVFHVGNRDSTLRSPGVFLHDGHLVVCCSTSGEWNRRCWKSEEALAPEKTHRLILTLSESSLRIYFGSELVRSLELNGRPSVPETVWLGRHPKEESSVDASFNLYCLKGEVDHERALRFPSLGKYLSNYGMALGASRNGIFDLSYDNYDYRLSR